MITVHVKGSFNNIDNFLKHASNIDAVKILSRFGEEGVAALSSATPFDSGRTSEQWNYEIEKKGENWALYWTNDNINDGVPIAVILQYGHGTRNGGWVQGRDYINPAIQPVIDKIAVEAWNEVNRL